jgi:hypothetical protein
VRWATRQHCHIDRAACAWLIRRFIDHDADFVFVEDIDDVPTGATPFDMRGADLSHHRGNCSFETFLETYDLDDPVLWEIAKIVPRPLAHTNRRRVPRDLRAPVRRTLRIPHPSDPPRPRTGLATTASWLACQ